MVASRHTDFGTLKASTSCLRTRLPKTVATPASLGPAHAGIRIRLFSVKGTVLTRIQTLGSRFEKERWKGCAYFIVVPLWPSGIAFRLTATSLFRPALATSPTIGRRKGAGEHSISRVERIPERARIFPDRPGDYPVKGKTGASRYDSAAPVHRIGLTGLVRLEWERGTGNRCQPWLAVVSRWSLA
jgi:hypothetical protein